jgi:hypothetical protein
MSHSNHMSCRRAISRVIVAQPDSYRPGPELHSQSLASCRCIHNWMADSLLLLCCCKTSMMQLVCDQSCCWVR